jgi:hypothetical protein
MLFKAFEVKPVSGIKPIPPSLADNCKALGFNKIKPTSGKNLPYEPETVYPAALLPDGIEVVAEPLDPLTISNTLPASQ